LKVIVNYPKNSARRENLALKDGSVPPAEGCQGLEFLLDFSLYSFILIKKEVL